MNLYQTSELARFETYVDTDTGEVNLDAYNNAQIALADKQLAVVCYIKNKAASIGMLEIAIKDLQARKVQLESQQAWLKNYLLVNMQANGITEITANDLTFSAKIKINPVSVIIDEIKLIPEQYMNVPITPPPTPNKTMIKEAIQNGIEILGARLEQVKRVDIK